VIKRRTRIEPLANTVAAGWALALYQVLPGVALRDLSGGCPAVKSNKTCASRIRSNPLLRISVKQGSDEQGNARERPSAAILHGAAIAAAPWSWSFAGQ